VNPFGVLLATRRYWPLPGGWENVWARLLGEMVRRGHTATVLTPAWQRDWPDETIRGGVRIVRLRPPGRGGQEELRYLRRLALALRRLRPAYDVAIAAGLRGDAYASLGETKRSAFPVVLVPEQPGLAGDCHWQIESCCGPRAKRRCYQAAGYAAATPLIERELIAAGYARSRIRPVTLGVPLPTPTTLDLRRDARRSLAQADPALALQDDERLVVYVGRLRMNKGLETLLAAWRSVVATQGNVKLWFVGEGPDAGPLRERTFELGLISSVRLTGAFDDVDDIWRAADVAVCPTHDDGPAMALREAASYGLPIVASDVVTHRDLLDDGIDMVSYPRRDAGALAAALMQTLNEPEPARARGAKARDHILRQFTVERMTDDFERLLSEVAVARRQEARR
jgi:glycosyltransferase involved in cell wall biosynthesis